MLEAFFDYLDAKRPAEMYDEDHDQGTGHPTDHLRPVESEATKLLAWTVKQRISDATNFYLSTHHKRDEAKFSANARRVMDGLAKVIGDKPFEAVTRADTRTFVDAELARGAVTTSIRRRLLADSHPGDVLLIEQVDRLSRLNAEDWDRLKAELLGRRVRVVALDLPTSHMMVKAEDEMTMRMMDAMNSMMLDMLAAISPPPSNLQIFQQNLDQPRPRQPFTNSCQKPFLR